MTKRKTPTSTFVNSDFILINFINIGYRKTKCVISLFLSNKNPYEPFSQLPKYIFQLQSKTGFAKKKAKYKNLIQEKNIKLPSNQMRVCRIQFDDMKKKKKKRQYKNLN